MASIIHLPRYHSHSAGYWIPSPRQTRLSILDYIETLHRRLYPHRTEWQWDPNAWRSLTPHWWPRRGLVWKWALVWHMAVPDGMESRQLVRGGWRMIECAGLRWRGIAVVRVSPLTALQVLSFLTSIDCKVLCKRGSQGRTNNKLKYLCSCIASLVFLPRLW